MGKEKEYGFALQGIGLGARLFKVCLAWDLSGHISALKAAVVFFEK